jgi:flagellar hook-length control protein FliK
MAHKKNRPGIFAKLLEGLISKGKTSPGLKGKDPALVTEPEIPEGGSSITGQTGIKSQKAGQNSKKARNSGIETGIEAGTIEKTVISPEVFAFLAHNSPERTSPEEAETINFQDLGKGRGLVRPAEAVKLEDANPETNFLKEEVLVLSAGKEGEQSGLPGDISPNRGEKVSSKASSHNGKDNAKTAAADFRLALTRNAETGFLDAGSRADLFHQQKPSGGERDNPRYSETRGRKGREKLNIEVRDLRTVSDSGHAVGRDAGIADASKNHSFNSRLQPAPEIELAVDLSSERGRGEAAEKAGSDYSQSRVFEDALAGELRGNLSTDIVRNAVVIVRNGGEGTIRLSLRPASLGDVKIRIEMTENKITGHIIVESSEAFRAFERELPVLEKAFRDSGFSETSLEMSLASDYSGDGRNFGAGQQQEGELPALVPVFAASRYEAETDWVEVSPLADGTIPSAAPGRIPVNLLA